MVLLTLLAAVGGSLRGFLELYRQTMAWQAARHKHRERAGKRKDRPAFSAYYDLVADPVAAMFHTLLGAGAGALFAALDQISSSWAAVVVGASAPALLTQLGNVKAIRNAVNGPPAANEEIAGQAPPAAADYGEVQPSYHTEMPTTRGARPDQQTAEVTVPGGER